MGSRQRRVTIYRRFDADTRPERRRTLARVYAFAIAANTALDDTPIKAPHVEEQGDVDKAPSSSSASGSATPASST
ncbi:hypothetical protein [Nonomuraea wenchangensis]|uniref:hypothetical protein n=1 Tax=Nonomuraea wenchangensis TaxID=568860 RepID=UPI00116023A9|nr:hypothetical protein [Nonomuraea wenchangensis]